MIDSSNPSRFSEAKAELQKLVEHPLAKGKPVLLLSNRKDTGDVRKQQKRQLWEFLDLKEMLGKENVHLVKMVL